MILHPGILALLLGSTFVLLMLLYASAIGIKILAKWDFESSSATQLSLERQTYLVSTLTSYAFGFVLLSLFFFVYTVDDIHKLFVGAMCAVGSLNANPVGWNVLWAKMLCFFLAAIWLAANYFDQRAEDFPLIRIKYSFLLLLVPIICFDIYFQSRYFLGLEPEIITSCCGSLFSSKDSSVGSGMAGLPVKPMMWFFYLSLALHLGTTLVCCYTEKGFFRYLLTIESILLFFVAITSIVSFISLYIYELPTHHCPFDIVQKEYNFIGYPLYISLFCGVLFGLLPGIFHPLKKYPSLGAEVRRVEKKWFIWSILCIICFTVVATWPILFGNLTMQGYL
ncbi:MAG: hypothetical protein KQH63_15145 [Desulfobulbaceae bacterium]|nr:hypothetical protein [Desulfobulbaceae bacterium]